MFLKGGPGSGVKGHKTIREDNENLESFFGTKENYKIFESQGGLEILEWMDKFWGSSLIRILANAKLSFDCEDLHSSSAGAVKIKQDISEVLLREKSYPKEENIDEKDKQVIISHELGHLMFKDFILYKNDIKEDYKHTALNEVVEGLAVLHSGIQIKQLSESYHYQKYTVKTFDALQKYSQEKNRTIKQIFIELGAKEMNRKKRQQNIQDFATFFINNREKLNSDTQQFQPFMNKFYNEVHKNIREE